MENTITKKRQEKNGGVDKKRECKRGVESSSNVGERRSAKNAEQTTKLLLQGRRQNKLKKKDGETKVSLTRGKRLSLKTRFRSKAVPPPKHLPAAWNAPLGNDILFPTK